MGKLRMLFEARDKYPPYKDWSKSKVLAWEQIRLGYVYQKEKEIFKALMQGFNHGNILDVACGSGRFTCMFGEADYVGVDFSPSMTRLAKERNTQANFMLGDAFKLPFLDNCFDLIFACRLIHHYQDLTHLLSEVNRILKPNGVFVFDVTNSISLPSFVAKMLNITLYGKSAMNIEGLRIISSHRDFFLPSILYGLIPTVLCKALDRIFSHILPSRTFMVVTKR